MAINCEKPGFDPVLARTSVRRFTTEGVSDEDVHRLLVAAMAAPSARNQQPWEFYVTRDRDLLRRLSQTTPYATPTAGAALAIVACARTEGLASPAYVPQDMGACIENVLVEVASLGLGAVWMGVAPIRERMDEVASILDIPADARLEPFAIVAVGHPAEPVTPRGPERYDEARVHWA